MGDSVTVKLESATVTQVSPDQLAKKLFLTTVPVMDVVRSCPWKHLLNFTPVNPAFAGQFNKKCFKGELYIGARYQNAWDANRQYGCLCDQGYAGPSCENILCPSGADVLGGEGAESGRECSGRGSCDYKAGVCVCHAGYKGQACQTQSTYN